MKGSPQAVQQQFAPGWYPNPNGPGQRYFDGSQWTDQFQAAPVQQAPVKPKKSRIVLKVTIGVILGGVALMAGCAALISGAANEVAKEQNAVGITLSEFRSIDQGSTQTEVEATLGKPEDSQEFEQQIPELQSQPSTSSCIYYPESGQPLFEGKSFQLCFDGGKLTSKNAY